MTGRASGRPLRVGLIGAGNIAPHHLIAWRAVPDVDLVAICDIDLRRAGRRAAEFGVPKVYAVAEEMLEAERLDAVDIATWRETHGPLTRLAASVGVDVLCQKPLADTLGEAVALDAEVGEQIRLMVHENRRFGAHYRLMRRWVAEGRIGQVRQCLLTSYRSSMLPGTNGRRPAVQRAVHFGRVDRLMIAGSLTHQLDVLRSILGDLTVVAARALRTEPDIPGETVATILLETVDGAPVVVNGNSVTPGSDDSPWKGRRSSEPRLGERLEIAGSTGSIVFDGTLLTLTGPSPERVPIDIADNYQGCFDQTIAHFVDSLRTGDPFETSPADNLKTLRLVEDAYAAAGAIRLQPAARPA